MYHKHTNKCCLINLKLINIYHILTLGPYVETIISCYTLTEHELH